MDDFGITDRGCIITYSGKVFNLIKPDYRMIDIESISIGLSKTCRFGGQIKDYYSVAEHSVLATKQALFNKESLDLCKCILLHDAAEAYLGDVVKPLKNELNKYMAIERKMEKSIAKRFSIDLELNWPAVKLYDNGMFKLEDSQIRGFHKNLDRDRYIEIKDCDCQFWSPKKANKEFLKMAKYLEIS